MPVFNTAHQIIRWKILEIGCVTYIRNPMSEFGLYYGLGLDHILDVNGYDHILFVIVLCALYQSTDWKKVIIDNFELRGLVAGSNEMAFIALGKGHMPTNQEFQNH